MVDSVRAAARFHLRASASEAMRRSAAGSRGSLLASAGSQTARSPGGTACRIRAPNGTADAAASAMAIPRPAGQSVFQIGLIPTASSTGEPWVAAVKTQGPAKAATASSSAALASKKPPPSCDTAASTTSPRSSAVTTSSVAFGSGATASVDRDRLANFGLLDESDPFLGFGSSMLYLDSEIPESTLVPDSASPYLVWPEATRKIEVDDGNPTELNTYRYTASEVAPVAAYGRELLAEYGYQLSGLTPEERAAVIAYASDHRELGYRRLAYQMLDEGVAALRPSTVYHLLREADLIGRWKRPAVPAHRRGFRQPDRPHEQWHTDIAYLNIMGSQYFLISVLDGFSRAIVHHEIRTRMETTDVEIVIQRALDSLPGDAPRPRLISDNGSQYVSGQFKAFLRESGCAHSKARVRHPQSNGKIERWHRTGANLLVPLLAPVGTAPIVGTARRDALRGSRSDDLLIGRGGDIVQMVAFNRKAWHAGRSSWNGVDGLNSHSIGIELDNAGELSRTEGGDWRAWFGETYKERDVLTARHRHDGPGAQVSGWHVFPREQLDALMDAAAALHDKYGFEAVLGHDDIAPRRKRDPGPAFPMGALRARLFGRAEEDGEPEEACDVCGRVLAQ